MDTGNYIDLAVGLAQAALGVFLSWRAFIVSLKDLTEKEQRRHMVIFGVSCLAVVALAGVQTYRNFDLGKKLDKIEANTSKPQAAPVVNVPAPIVNMPSPPEHTHVSWIVGQTKNSPLLPLHEGEDPAVGLGIRNIGDFPIPAANPGGLIRVIPSTKFRQAFPKFLKQLEHHGQTGTLVAHANARDDIRYSTYVGPKLKGEDVENLLSGKSGLCAIGSLQWEDATGKYETYLYKCMVIQPDHTFNWSVLPENDTEHKR